MTNFRITADRLQGDDDDKLISVGGTTTRPFQLAGSFLLPYSDLLLVGPLS